MYTYMYVYAYAHIHIRIPQAAPGLAARRRDEGVTRYGQSPY